METGSFLTLSSGGAWNEEAQSDPDWLQLAADRLLFVTRAVASASTFQAMLKAVAEACVGIGGAESAGIYLLEPDRRAFTVGWEATIPEWPDVRAAGDRIPLRPWSGMVQALELSQPVPWQRDDESLSDFERRHYETEEIGSGIDVPLICRGEALGFLNLFRRAEEPWSERDVRIAAMIGSTIALALASESLLDRAVQQSRDQAALARLAQVAIAPREARDLMRRVADEIRALLPFPCVDIELWSTDLDRGEIIAHSAPPGWQGPTNGVIFYRLSDWPSDLRLLREMQTITLDEADDLQHVERTYMELRNLAQLHFVPLVYGERCLGAIILQADRRVTIDGRLRDLIAEAAAITALAAHAARSLRETEWERRAQAWQLRVNRALLNDAPMERVLDEALASLVDMTGVAAALLEIVRPDTGEAFESRIAVAPGFRFDEVQGWRAHAWPIAHDAREKRLLQIRRIADESAGAANASMLSKLGLEWVVAAPLIHDHRLYGTMTLVYPAEFTASEDSLDFIRQMSRQAAVVASSQLLRAEQLHAARRAAIMLQVTQAAVAGNDLDHLLGVIAQAALELDRVDGCEIVRHDPWAGAIVNETFAFSGEWRFDYEPGFVHVLNDWPSYQSVIDERAPRAFLADSPDLSAFEQAAFRGVGIGSALLIPLSLGEELLGVLSLFREAAIPFSRRTTELAVELAAQASLALGRAQLFDALQARADSDGVTGLFNHRAILERIDRALATTAGGNEPVSLMLIDLDGFKQLNDIRGHLTGDRYLREVAALIQESVGDRGEVARYGGDEFLVLLPGVDLAACRRIADAILERSRETEFTMEDGAAPFLFSVGVATAPLHGVTRDELIREADRAMYDAKQRGGGRLGRPSRADSGR